MKNGKELLKLFRTMIKEIFCASPLTSVYYALCDLLHAASYIIVLWRTQILFDTLITIEDFHNCTHMFGALAGFFCAYLLLEVSNGLANFHFEYLSDKVLIELHKKMHKKVKQIEAAEYEDINILNMIERAGQGIEAGYLTVLFLISIVTFYVPYFIFLGLYLSEMTPMMLIVIFLIFLPVIVGKIIRIKMYFSVEDKLVSARFDEKNLEEALTRAEAIKENRVLGAFDYLFQKRVTAAKKIQQMQYINEKKNVIMNLGLKVFTGMAYIGIVIISIFEMKANQISPGEFAAIFGGIGMMYNFAQEVFDGILGYISRSTVYLRNYARFLDYETGTMKDISSEQSDEVKVEGVSFVYPGNSEKALDHISFTMKRGEIVAIVGKNGSGKTTLAKLLLGIYQPAEGKILTFGYDTASRDWKSAIKASAVFQNYNKYKMSLRDNIIISESNRKADMENVCAACNKMGINERDEVFSKGYETVLAKEFGGTDLSGGNWQRIALARGIYRESDFIVLDEPTSAIDPIEEGKLYSAFSKVVNEKTSIIITHRLGLVKIADRIIVLENGTKVQEGTHADLVSSDGVYKEMYEEQAGWYR